MTENIIFFDIETTPSQQPGIKEQILSELKCPGNITKQTSVAKWWQEKAPALAEQAYLKTALDGTFGELISISWAFNMKPVQGFIRHLDEPESKVLQTFFDALEEADTGYLAFCGHNILNFDLPFLWQRAVINNVRPPIGIPRRRGSDILDTMEMWAGYNGHIAFDTLCHALGLQGKTDMDGSMVYQACLDGEYEKVLAYNKQDVEQVRACYKKLVFVDWAPEDPEDEKVKANEENKKLEETGFFDPVMKDI